MADLTAADVTVTQPVGAVFYPPQPYTIALAYVSWAAGKDYPVGGLGVPMPAGNLFGMKKVVGYSPPIFVDGYMCIYDATNHTIRIYQCAGAGSPMVELGHVAVPALSFPLFVVGE